MKTELNKLTSITSILQRLYELLVVLQCRNELGSVDIKCFHEPGLRGRLCNFRESVGDLAKHHSLNMCRRSLTPLRTNKG